MATCEACNTIPPVAVENYTVKGSWIELCGLRTYVTGTETSTKGIVDIYDAFGAAPQTLQGADLLAAALKCFVIVPDFFKDEPAKNEWYTNPTEENNAKKAAFMGVMGRFDEYVKTLLNVVQEAKGKWPRVQSWGAMGLCWGGKVRAMASQPGTPFKASGQVHPGRLAADDYKKMEIPHIILASNGEDEKIVKECHDILVGGGKPGVVETYGTMHHGWMGARAKLEDDANLKEYERGYNQLAAFFGKHL